MFSLRYQKKENRIRYSETKFRPQQNNVRECRQIYKLSKKISVHLLLVLALVNSLLLAQNYNMTMIYNY